MMGKVVKLLVLPASIVLEQEAAGVFRGWIDCTGDLTVETPFALDTLDGVKVLAAFEKLARADGFSPRGCAFVSTSS